MIRFLYTLMPLLAGMFWGSTGPFVRTLEALRWNAFTILYARMLTASVLMFLVMFLFRRSLLRIHWKDLWIFILAGAVFTMGLNVFYQESITRLTLSLAAVLLGMSPVFVLLIARILFGEKLTRLKVGCMFLAIFGCVLVSGVLEQGAGSNVTPLSILIGIASAACYAMQSIMVRVATDRGYHALTTGFYSLLSVGIVTFFLADHGAIRQYTAAAPLPHWGFLFLMGICVSILPTVLFNTSLTRIETGKASILASAGEPSAATVFGMIFYHEEPTALTLTGLVLVIIALAILCRPAASAAPGED